MDFKFFLSKLVFFIGGIKLNYQLRYFHNRKRFPNFKNPKDWSERVLASMLSPSFLKYAKFVDKINVRNYVKEKGLQSILLEHFGTWEKPSDIDFSKLPNKFALKTNNGVGNHYFCKNKLDLNRALCLKQLENNLSIIESQDSILEPQYKSITPLIFCEELIDTGTDSWPIDYKIHCINGEPDHVFLAMEREGKVKYGTFDLDWNMLPYTRDAFKPTTYPKKPKYLKEMFEISRILSKDFEFVRVDLYEHGDRIIFGELTFSPWGGFMYSYTNESIKLIGSKYK
jgi:hypothetical protein